MQLLIYRVDSNGRPVAHYPRIVQGANLRRARLLLKQLHELKANFKGASPFSEDGRAAAETPALNRLVQKAGKMFVLEYNPVIEMERFLEEVRQETELYS